MISIPLGRVFRQGHLGSGARHFSANTALLETFSQIVGSSAHKDGHNGITSGSLPKGDGVEFANEYNVPRGYQVHSEQFNYRVGEFYEPGDLVAPQAERQVVGTEVRQHVDPFRRHKASALMTHKNTHLLSTMLSQTGRLLPQRITGHSSKTQRQLSKAVRRARQMGLLPYMFRPKVF